MAATIMNLMTFLSGILLIAGFYVLIKAADILVSGASSLAKKLSISEIAIGLTIVAFGTSAPELIVNILASASGYNEICFGNIIGSNIFNTLVVLGVAGLIYPIPLQTNTVKKEIPMAFAGTILIMALSNNFGFAGALLSRIDGLILLISLVFFFVYVLGISKESVIEEVEIKSNSIPRSLIMIIIGILGLFLGGEMVVKNAVFTARLFNVSEKFIAITIVALGTSLPELVTSVMAVKKKRFDLAVGNVIGSNLLNIFLVLGITAVIKPVLFPLELNADFIFLIVVTFLLFLTMLTGGKKRIDRWEAAVFVMLYVLYIVFLIYRR
jgi:cation:H+ antiporter